MSSTYLPSFPSSSLFSESPFFLHSHPTPVLYITQTCALHLHHLSSSNYLYLSMTSPHSNRLPSLSSNSPEFVPISLPSLVLHSNRQNTARDSPNRQAREDNNHRHLSPSQPIFIPHSDGENIYQNPTPTRQSVDLPQTSNLQLPYYSPFNYNLIDIPTQSPSPGHI